ncbi:hypothetical protein SH449x_005308 [Pirellulaceae bacterium SH449]
MNRLGMVVRIVVTSLLSVFFVAHESKETWAESPVTVSYLDGRNVTGSLVSLGPTDVIVEIAGKKETISNAAIANVSFTKNAGSTAGDSLQLELVDGSKLFGSKFLGKGNSWKLESTAFGTVDIPATSLRHLLIKQHVDSAQESEWSEALSEEGNNDALIVVRATGELVRVGGTIREAKPEQISFDFDDQRLDMPLERLKGLTWFQSEKPRAGTAVAVLLTNNSLLQTNAIELADNNFSLTLRSGSKLSVPASSISAIQFSAANVRWIAELPVLESGVQEPSPWAFSLPASKSALLPRFVRFRTTIGSTREILPVSEQDLLFVATGQYVFRMPAGFRKLQATVERPTLADFRSDLLIEVWQEDEKLFSKTLTDSEDSMEVNVDVIPEKRTKLSVMATGKSPLGTEVQWKQVRALR